MKWGIRRYQNKDGTLTAAGKQRYSSDEKQYRNALKNVKKFYDDFANDKKRVEKHLIYSTFWDGVPTPFEDEPDYNFEKYLPKMLNDKDCIDLAYTNLMYGRHAIDDRQAEEDLKKLNKLLDEYQASLQKLMGKRGFPTIIY